MRSSIRYLTSNFRISQCSTSYSRPASFFSNHRILFSNSSEALVNSYTERTHTCGQLSKNDIGKRVNLFGWVQYTRFNCKIIALRDSYGVVQCIVDRERLNESIGNKADITNESVVQVSGIVRARPIGQENNAIPTGDVEIEADRVSVLSTAKKDVPLLTREDPNSSSTTAVNRLKYRYLDLRSSRMQHALRFRSHACRVLRNKLYDLNFVECETPTLFNRTPGGANEFIVPTRLQNKFYSLVQSPQQLKQLLMIGGLDRYFQICRCYRDESGRPDRQPEFTQVDIELSFSNRILIMKLVEQLLYELLTKISDEPEVTKSLISSFSDDRELEKVSFKEAFENYGTDKPDTRFDWLIENDENDGLFIDIPHNLSQERLVDVIESLKVSRPDLMSTKIVTEARNAGTVQRIKTLDRSVAAKKLLGVLRVLLANELNNQVNGQGKLEPNHHPFTAPTQDTIHLLKVDPLRVIGQHYDLVLNGQEVAGGSIRIHDALLQRQIFTETLGVREDTFNYFIDALSSGCPPHGGIAIGLDRLVAILMDRPSIKEVIAFPKSSSGRDLMTDCPQEIGVDLKHLYNLNY